MKTDFTSMTGPELVTVFNEMCTKAAEKGIDRFKPVQRFGTREKGITRCSTLYLALVKAGVRVNGDGPKAKAKGKSSKGNGAERTGIVAEFGTREGTNREKLLLALADNLNKPTSQTALIKAVYGSKEGDSGALGMVMKGLFASIASNKLPYKIVKSKDSKEVYFELQATK